MLSNVILFGITRLRLPQEQIENRLYILLYVEEQYNEFKMDWIT